jgi:hypothetical protein
MQGGLADAEAETAIPEVDEAEAHTRYREAVDRAKDRNTEG